MIPRQSRQRPGPRRQSRATTLDHDVGYGKPPRQHQFRPGQSGNPRGRAKGVKNESTLLHDLLHRKVEIREGGRTRKIIVFEAILLRFTESALKGRYQERDVPPQSLWRKGDGRSARP